MRPSTDAPACRGAKIECLGVSVPEWGDTAIAACEVVIARLVVLSRGEPDAVVELQRAVLEKVAYCARWSWVLAVGGWLDLEGSLTRAARDMREEVAGNRERLALRLSVAAERG